MKKVLLISDSAPAHPRLRKLGNLFENHEIKFLLWNRGHINSEEKDSFIFNSTIGYGNKLKILKEIPKLLFYMRRILKEYNPDIIVARYFLIGFIVSLISPKKIKIYYDVCDMPMYNNYILTRFLRITEKLILIRSDKVILGSRYFQDFYPKYSSKLIILENKVEKEVLNSNLNVRNNSQKLIISFIGKVRYIEILKNIAIACENLPVVLNFYGDGSDIEEFKEFVEKNKMEYINFFGRYNYVQITSYYEDADVILSSYPSRDRNVKYAIPNKFFEAIHFNKPIIVSRGTKLAALVEENNLGFSINCYDVTDIKNSIEEIVRDRDILQDKMNSILNYKLKEDIYWDYSIDL